VSNFFINLSRVDVRHVSSKQSYATTTRSSIAHSCCVMQLLPRYNSRAGVQAGKESLYCVSLSEVFSSSRVHCVEQYRPVGLTALLMGLLRSCHMCNILCLLWWTNSNRFHRV